jgi:Taurine catabolism dioxygenase TauD, TfdA family
MDVLERTVLRVKNRAGHIRYLLAVVPIEEGQKKVRWDPRSCEPITEVAITDQIGHLPSTVQLDWEEKRLLVIDNRKLLHRRPAVVRDSARTLERTYVWEV